MKIEIICNNNPNTRYPKVERVKVDDKEVTGASVMFEEVPGWKQLRVVVSVPGIKVRAK